MAQDNGKRVLVTCFSATGTTAQAAARLADITGGKLYVIKPAKPYTSADLDWHDKQSRSSVEMNNPKSRPPLADKAPDMSDYDIVFIGYPIWWNQAPRIINTFIESCKLKGKTLIPFATSGGSSIENSVKTLKTCYAELSWAEGKLLNNADETAIRQWIAHRLNNTARGNDSQRGMCTKLPMQSDGIVRLSKIDVYPEHLEAYMKFAIEVGEASLRTEPGVLTMYALQEQDNPCRITILETYASQEAYKAHIASTHFQKYKQSTLHMVKSLVLSDQKPLNPANRVSNYIQ